MMPGKWALLYYRIKGAFTIIFFKRVDIHVSNYVRAPEVTVVTQDGLEHRIYHWRVG